MNAKGIWAVAPVLVSLWCPSGSAQETLLTDAFDRANSATVGNGWVEMEATGAAAGISNGRLVFTDTSDVVRRPMLVHALPNTTSGLVVWEFQLDRTRTGNESVYFVYMQLGDGSRMSADSVDAGVAVNLVWTRIGGVDQQLGFRRDGTVTALRTLNGVATVRVSASLEQATYDVAVNGAVVRSQVPFDSAGPLSAVRLFTDALNDVNFAGRSFDLLRITREPATGGNVAPVAANDNYSVAQDNLLSIAAPGVLGNDVDADGDALTARLVSNVSRGSLSLGPGGSFSYSPDVGFTGTDAFTYVASDGTHESAVATVSIEVGQQPVLFTDSFGRANGASVGNGWIEVEAVGAAAVLDGGRLTFADTSDAVLRPLVRHTFPEVTSGSLTWEFELDWTRVGSESAYAVYMQLGDGAQMSADARNAGVGVNLVWTRIGTQDQMLGFSRAGATTALRPVVGHATIRVNVDVDTHQYDVFVDGVPVRSGVAFDVLVALNTVRFFTDGLNEVNFSGRAFDNVSVRGRSSGGGGNTVPTARAQSLRVVDGVAKTITLTYTDGDGPGPYTFDVVDLPRHGTLADDDGDATVIYTGSSGFVGADSFTFRVNDGLATSNLATVSLSVQHYPGATWETRTPAQVGLDAARLDQFVASVGGVGSIVRNGYMVRTWGDQTSKADWASASKPLMNTLLFFAVQENRIDAVEDPVSDWVAAATGGTLRPADQSMTIFQLMNMTSGYARIENPGAAWAYNDVAVQLKNRVVGAIFGELPDAPIRARLAPLQLQDGSLFTTRGGYGLSTTTRDFARIAWFWMNRGNWRGQQVLDEQFFDDYMKILVPFSLPRTTGADVDYLNVGTTGGGTDQTPYGPGQFGMNWWFNQPVGSLGRPWPAAPADMIQTHGHFNREMVIFIPSLNLVVTNRGSWGTFVPWDASSGVNQRLRLLMLAVTS
ncbi:MAG TPA: Ig-like domain-containing protein [Gammaproteobacteria bacterium]